MEQYGWNAIHSNNKLWIRQSCWQAGGGAVRRTCLEGRARPDEHRAEAALLDVGQVRKEDVLVDNGAEGDAGACAGLDLWLKVLDAVQVAKVHPSVVGRWAVIPILLHVEAVEADVHAIDPLEQQDDLCT